MKIYNIGTINKKTVQADIILEIEEMKFMNVDYYITRIKIISEPPVIDELHIDRYTKYNDKHYFKTFVKRDDLMNEIELLRKSGAQIDINGPEFQRFLVELI